MDINKVSLDGFNVFQDEENYYVFRALNNADHRDIISGVTADESGILRVRTNRERAEEEKGEAKYNAQSEISLEEVYDHVKIRHLKETNCISLSTNANVAIDYGQGYKEEYVMIRIPKQKTEDVYNAGEYMLAEVEKKINEILETISTDSEIIDLFKKIDSETSHNNIRTFVSDIYTGIRKVGGKFTGKGKEVGSKISVYSRLDRRQYFTDEQQLEYDKIIAKLTILEMTGLLRSIIPSKSDNTSLIATIGLAFSSGEIIHYNDIERAEMTSVSKEMMDVLSLVQQLKEKDVNQEELASLEHKVIELVQNGYEISKENGRIVMKNSEVSIDIQEDDGETKIEEKQDLSIEDIYSLTKGKISYERAKIALDFAVAVARSRKKAIGYAEVIRQITTKDSGLAQMIQDECYVIDNRIISRENNSGIKIAESVNIGMNRTERQFVSNEEQVALIRNIQELDVERLDEIIVTNGRNIEENILESLFQRETEISESQFFAEAIVDGIDLDRVYKSISEEKRNMSADEREKLINGLKNADCKRLYNAFRAAGVSHSNISGYIVNLLMDGGYKGYSLEEFSRLENLDEIILKNVKNLNCRIQAMRLDKAMGIEDDSYAISGTEITLREYQQLAFENVVELFKEKKFASMILPTGAGKSFVAMSIMMQFQKSNIIFVAPQNTILLQFQTHIIKNVIGREDVAVKDYSKVIEEAFPHLKMFCYDTMSERDEEWLKSHDADLIILDELHRAGAKTWEPQIESLIKKNPNAKVLGMTATPIRDVDHKDMARRLAEMSGSYTAEELMQKKYLATEMYLLDAMQDSIVVSPKVVTFDYSLGESEEYQEIKRMIEVETDPEKKERYREIYREMTKIIRDSEKLGINRVILENIKKKDGRYIVFLPYNKDPNLSSEEYMRQEIEKVKEFIRDIDPNPEIEYLLSDRADKKENLKALKRIEESKSKHLKLVFAIDMLNEGVHLDGIDGAIMLRPISENSKILYLQQIGRCIFSQDPNNPVSEEDRPVIFDVYNNYLAQRLDREINKTNQTSDLQRLQELVLWIKRHKGYIPDINSEDINEARKAIVLKRIQQKYKLYLDKKEKNNNLSESELEQIKKIIELGKAIDLWDMEIPDRIVPPGEKDIIRNDTFRVSGTQREFLELFKKAKSIARGSQDKTQEETPASKSLKIKNILEKLDILVEYGVEITNESINENRTIKDLLKDLPSSIRTIILEELELDIDYCLMDDFTFVKQAFYEGNRTFLEYDIKDLRKYGIFEEIDKEKRCAVRSGFIVNGPKAFRGLNIMTGTFLDEEGYDCDGIDEKGFQRGKETNGYGFYRNGIHSETNEIYDPRGFKIDLTYRETGEKYDELGFDIYGKHKKTGRKINEYGFDFRGHYLEEPDLHKGFKDLGIFDRRGFDIHGRNRYTAKYLDKEGYDRDGFYHELQEDGTYIKTDKIGASAREKLVEIDKYGFDKWGIHKVTKEKYDENGFDVYGFHKKTGTRIDENRKTRDGYIILKTRNESGIKVYSRKTSNGEEVYFDLNGNYVEKQEDGTYMVTNQERDSEGYNVHGLDENNFDREGIYWKIQSNGKYKSTGKSRNPEGYDKNGLDEHCFDREGIYWEKQEDGSYKSTGKTRDPEGFEKGGVLNERNFDRKGIYWKKQKDGSYKSTGKTRDPRGYDKDGLDPHYFREGEAINKYGFDRQGYYYELQENGEYVSTGLKYNKFGFGMTGKHMILGGLVDYRRFDISGRCKANKNSIYDANGFKQDGTYMETGEKYHNGYNAYGVDEEGKYKTGKERTEVTFAKEYVQSFLAINPREVLLVVKKFVPQNNFESSEEYKRRMHLYIKEKLYLAEQMYPKIRKEIIYRITLLENEIQKREQQIRELESQPNASIEQIDKIRKENRILRKRIELISNKNDLDK